MREIFEEKHPGTFNIQYKNNITYEMQASSMNKFQEISTLKIYLYYK